MRRCSACVLLYVAFYAVVRFSWSAIQPEAFDLSAAYNGFAQITEYVTNFLVVLVGAVIAAVSYDPHG